MSKTKSAIILTFVTLIIAVLCVVCFASFPAGGINYYNSLLSLSDKDADLGDYLIGDTAYVGGGYAVVYYPEGVISSREYEEMTADLTGDDLEEYQNRYLFYADGALYLEKEIVCEDGSDAVSAAFVADFDRMKDMLRSRFESLDQAGMSMQIVDDYTVRVFLPATMEASAAAFTFFSYMGEFTISFGSDESSATVALPSPTGTARPASYYIRGASAASQSGTHYVQVEFTDEGQALIADLTADTTGTMIFRVGENDVLSLTISEQINQNTLYISGSYTAETAVIVASLIDSAVNAGEAEDVSLTLGDISSVPALMGENALILLYIVLGVLMLLSLIFFFVRYHRLGFVHLYSFLTYLTLSVVCIWAAPGITVSLGAIVAFVIGAVMLSIGDLVSFEYARKEFANGKTMTYSVKTGYKKCMWHIFDAHIVAIVFGLLTYAIGIAELCVFGAALGLCATLSGVCTLLINRFYWSIMMPFAKSAAAFCNFKKVAEEDDDE